MRNLKLSRNLNFQSPSLKSPKSIKDYVITSNRSSISKSPVFQVQNKINDLLSEDRKKNNKRKQSGRDVSYIKDARTQSMSHLPMQIPPLEKMKASCDSRGILQSISQAGSPAPVKCTKPHTIERIFQDMPCNSQSEGYFLGAPSGRQDVENLKEWYCKMKESEDFELVLEMCSREMVRQVSIQCIERGELLRILFQDYLKVGVNAKQKVQEEAEKSKKKWKESVDLEKNRLEKLAVNLKVQTRLAEGDMLKYKDKKNTYKEKLANAEAMLEKLKSKYKILKEKWKKHSLSFQGGLVPSAMNIKHSLFSASKLSPTQSILHSDRYQSSLEKSFDLSLYKKFSEAEVQTEIVIEDLESASLQDQSTQTIWSQNITLKSKNLRHFSTLLPRATEKSINIADCYTQTDSFALNIENAQDVLIERSATVKKHMSKIHHRASSELKSSEGLGESSEFVDNDLIEIIEIKDQLIRALEDLMKRRRNVRRVTRAIKNFIGNIEVLQTDLNPPMAEDTEELMPEFMDPVSWKAGYSIGFEKGTGQGLKDGELLGTENGKVEGYIQAINDIQTDPQLIEVIDNSPNASVNCSIISLHDSQDIDQWEEVSKIQEAQNTDPSIKKRLDDFSRLETSRFSQSNIELNIEDNGKSVKKNPEENKNEENNNLEKLEEEEKISTKNTEKNIEEADKRSSVLFTTLHKPRNTLKTMNLSSKGSDLKSEKHRFSLVTIVKEFHFNTKEQQVYNKKKNNTGSKKLEALLKKPLKSVIKKGVMSRKMVLKTIALIYSAFSAKPRSYEDDLIDVVYDEFIKKYGLKTVCEKKFVEFLSSLFCPPESLRIQNFLRMLGAGHKKDLENLSKHSMMFGINLWRAMCNSKVGKMIAIDDSAEQILFPLSRAHECAKEKIEPLLQRNDYTSLITSIDSLSVADPKRINVNGLLDIDLYMDRCLGAYEVYQKSIKQGVEFLQTMIQVSQSIERHEFDLLVRHISPSKYQLVAEDTNLEDEEGFVTIDTLLNKSIEVNCLGINDIYSYPCEMLKTQELFQIVMKKRSELFDIANYIRNRGNNNVDIIEYRLTHLGSSVFTMDNFMACLGWKIYSDELYRLQNEC